MEDGIIELFDRKLFSEALSSRIEDMGWDESEAASRMSIRVPVLRSYVCGAIVPKLSTLSTICARAGFSLVDLIRDSVREERACFAGMLEKSDAGVLSDFVTEKHGQGISIAEIARMAGISKNKVSKVLLDAGITERRRSRPRFNFTAEQIDDFCLRHRAGESMASIASEVGASVTTVSKAMSASGYVFTRGGRGSRGLV